MQPSSLGRFWSVLGLLGASSLLFLQVGNPATQAAMLANETGPRLADFIDQWVAHR
jgi:hypothetical protein